MKKYLSLLLVLALLLGTLLAMPLAAHAAENDMNGISFTQDGLYKPAKLLDKTPNTLEAWVYLPTTLKSSDRAGVIIGSYGAGNPNVNFEIHSNGHPRLYWVEADGTVSDWLFSGVSVPLGEWTHVAVVRDAAAGKVHCYINGALKASMNDKGSTDVISPNAFLLGGDHRGGNAQYFKGMIAGVAMYSDVRTAQEIKSDMTIPGDEDLLVYYDIEYRDNDYEILDDSGNGYHLRCSQTWIADKEPVSDYAFSFIVIGDTQVLSDKYPDKLPILYDYVMDSLQKKNVKFVFGLGDITERSTQTEWDVALENIHRMDGKVAYSVVRGNHDTAATFKAAFPLSDYQSVIGGTYDGSMLNAWQTLTVGSIKYLMLTLDFGASDAVLNWAGDVISAHPDHNVIITTHSYLFRDGTTLDQNDVCPPATNGGYNNGDHTWDKLIKKHENIVLVISGHDPCNEIVLTQTEGDNGNIVSQMLVDPQGVDSGLGGVGLVATLYFSEDGRSVTVDYYSTIREQYFMTENQFTFTLDLIDVEQPDDSTEDETDTPDTDTTTPDDQTPDDQTPTEEKNSASATVGSSTVILIIVIAAVIILGLVAAIVVILVKSMKKK